MRKAQMFIVTMIFLAGLIFFVHQGLLQYSIIDISEPLKNDYHFLSNLKEMFSETMITSDLNDLEKNLNQLSYFMDMQTIKGYSLNFRYKLDKANIGNIPPNPAPLNLTFHLTGPGTESRGVYYLYAQSGPEIKDAYILPCSGVSGTIFTITARIWDRDGIDDSVTKAIILNSDRTSLDPPQEPNLYDDGTNGDITAEDGSYTVQWDSTGFCPGGDCLYSVDIESCDILGYCYRLQNIECASLCLSYNGDQTLCEADSDCGFCTNSNTCMDDYQITCDGSQCNGISQYCSNSCAWSVCSSNTYCSAGSCIACPQNNPNTKCCSDTGGTWDSNGFCIGDGYCDSANGEDSGNSPSDCTVTNCSSHGDDPTCEGDNSCDWCSNSGSCIDTPEQCDGSQCNGVSQYCSNSCAWSVCSSNTYCSAGSCIACPQNNPNTKCCSDIGGTWDSNGFCIGDGYCDSANGETSGNSPNDCTITGNTIIVHNTEDSSGQITTIPIDMQNEDTIWALQFDLEFDNNILNYNDAEITSRTTNHNVNIAEETGKISVMVFSMDPSYIITPGAGSILNIKFDVIGSTGETSILYISNLILTDNNGNELQSSSQSGMFTVI